MLRISTRGRYAARIMVCLAMADAKVRLRKQQIAESEQISGDYVEQILTRLKAAQLVTSHRGTHGGFTLARSAETISVKDIIVATEGPVCLVSCEAEHCSRKNQCAITSVWQRANDTLAAIFSETKLSDLANETISLRKSKPFIFQI
ncbi:MAG: Rrf2 family transcriptional regulator [Lentisphaerae bacterium]|nr:Rrf2 family transcriptional regulator [Lentisphaerota bacterium]